MIKIQQIQFFLFQIFEETWESNIQISWWFRRGRHHKRWNSYDFAWPRPDLSRSVHIQWCCFPSSWAGYLLTFRVHLFNYMSILNHQIPLNKVQYFKLENIDILLCFILSNSGFCSFNIFFTYLKKKSCTLSIFDYLIIVIIICIRTTVGHGFVTPCIFM